MQSLPWILTKLYKMEHHHGHPLTRAMELRPDHWSTTLKSHLKVPRIYVLTTYYIYSINHEIFTTHVNIISIFVIILHSYLIFSQPQLILPTAIKMESYIMPIPCRGTSFIFHESLHISYPLLNQLMMLNSMNQSHTNIMLTSCQNPWIIIFISFIQGHSIHTIRTQGKAY